MTKEFELLETLMRAANRPVLPISRVARPSRAAPFAIASNMNGYGMMCLDLTLTMDGTIRLIEANGSNAGATSFGTADGDRLRASHFVAAALNRIATAPHGVVVMAYAPGTLLLAEHAYRAQLVCREIERLGRSAALRDSSGTPVNGITVVVDTTTKIASHITVRDGKLFYDSIPVIAAGNPNLIPELVRLGVVKRRANDYDFDYAGVFHEGRLVPLVHDKCAQQVIARGTGIEPLMNYECRTIDKCVDAITKIQKRGRAAVAKMNAGSGGAGIEFFAPPSSDREVRDRITALLEDAGRKYPGGVEKTVWPIRVFEFVQSTGYQLADGPHLWDTRIACFWSPGLIELTVCGLRLCPEPFDGTSFDPRSVKSNTSHREPTVEFIRSPLTDGDGPGEEFLKVGVDANTFERMLRSTAHWCEAAWHAYTPMPAFGYLGGWMNSPMGVAL